MSRERTVHVVVPDGIEDADRPSGGNTYDRRLCEELTRLGWSVHTHPVAGDWPRAADADRRRLGRVLAALTTGSSVVVDGLVASAVPEVLVPGAHRLRLVVLLHMPLGRRGASDVTHRREAAVLGAAASVVTPSEWCRRSVLSAYGLAPVRVHVVPPGVDPAEPAPRGAGDRLVCVGTVSEGKGHDLLLAALAGLTDVTWRCQCVGPLGRDAGFVRGLIGRIRDAGLEERFVLEGPRSGRDLAASYARADVLVLASRAETYGMVVTEALARALPVVAPAVGGVPEALGTTSGGRRPGLLVAPDDVAALADGLRRWLGDPVLRDDLRTAAAERRTTLTGWPDTARRVADVLAEVAT